MYSSFQFPDDRYVAPAFSYFPRVVATTARLAVDCLESSFFLLKQKKISLSLLQCKVFSYQRSLDPSNLA